MSIKDDLKKAAKVAALVDPITFITTATAAAATSTATTTATTGVIVPKVMTLGSNSSILASAIAEKTETPPTDEKPIYILCYTNGPLVGHVAAVYDKERIDYYPKNVADKTAALSDIGNILLNQNTESTFKPASDITQTCYAIYPSQLGLDAGQVEKAFQDVKKEKDAYNLYNNNCADQIIKVFEKCGIDMNKNKFGIATLPADVRNFALKNGYKVSPENIPNLTDLRAEMKKDAEDAKTKEYTDVKTSDVLTLSDKKQKHSCPNPAILAYHNGKQKF